MKRFMPDAKGRDHCGHRGRPPGRKEPPPDRVPCFASSTWHRVTLLLATAAFAAPAPAQPMYRCGSTYSQTPCGPTATATRTFSDAVPDKPAGSQAGAACAAQALQLLNVPDPAGLRVVSTSASRAEVIQYAGQPMVAQRYDMHISTVSPAGVWLAARPYSCFLSEDQQRILKFETRRP